ncbi:MAG: hypothetical protein ACLU0O_07090 [Collinsella sp.]
MGRRRLLPRPTASIVLSKSAQSYFEGTYGRTHDVHPQRYRAKAAEAG